MRRLVGNNFARLRKERGLTQEQVEERSGFSQWYLSKLEAGRGNPTIISLYELANSIGVRVADLIDESGFVASDDMTQPRKRGPPRKLSPQEPGKS